MHEKEGVPYTWGAPFWRWNVIGDSRRAEQDYITSEEENRQ